MNKTEDMAQSRAVDSALKNQSFNSQYPPKNQKKNSQQSLSHLSNFSKSH